MKKKISPETKAQAVLKALKEADTIASIGSTYSVHPKQIGIWTKRVKDNLYTLFDKENSELQKIINLEKQVDELHRIIGSRDEELAWLQKKSTITR